MDGVSESVSQEEENVLLLSVGTYGRRTIGCYSRENCFDFAIICVLRLCKRTDERTCWWFTSSAQFSKRIKQHTASGWIFLASDRRMVDFDSTCLQCTGICDVASGRSTEQEAVVKAQI